MSRTKSGVSSANIGKCCKQVDYSSSRVGCSPIRKTRKIGCPETTRFAGTRNPSAQENDHEARPNLSSGLNGRANDGKPGGCRALRMAGGRDLRGMPASAVPEAGQAAGFDLLLKDATARKVNMIAAWSVDRLGRSLQDLVGFLTELQALGCDFYLHQQARSTPGRRQRSCCRTETTDVALLQPPRDNGRARSKHASADRPDTNGAAYVTGWRQQFVVSAPGAVMTAKTTAWSLQPRVRLAE
jgi:resolvase-like protein